MNNTEGRQSIETSIDNTKMRSDAKESKDILRGIGDTAVNEGSRMDKAVNTIGATIAGAFTAQAAIAFTKSIIQMRGEIESLEISFETLLGNKADADALMGEIRTFAASTPLLVQDLAKGAQMLLAFNVAAEDVMPILQSIGDISMGDSQKFQSLTLAFSQMSSTGKLMGQDLLQMINAGFNPLTVVADKTGKSIAQLKEEMSAGKISAEMITDAFKSATSEGGKFYGMLEKQSHGIKGSLSNLQGAWDDMLNDIGTKTEGVTTDAVLKMTDLVKNYEKLGKVIAEIVATYGVYRAALITLNAVKAVSTSVTAGYTVAELAQFNALLLVEKAQKLLNATILKNPYVLAAAAVAALALGIYKLATYQTASEKAQKKLNDAIKECDKNIGSEVIQIDAMFARLKAAKQGTDEYRAAREAIISRYGDYLRKLGDEKTALDDIATAYALITTEAKKAANARAMEKFTTGASDTLAEEEVNAKDKVKKLLDEKYKGQVGPDGISLAETYYWKIKPVIEGEDEITPEIEAIIKDFNKTVVSTGSPMFGGTTSSVTTNELRGAIKQATDARNVFTEVMNEARLKFGESPLDTGKKSGGKKDDEVVVKNKKFWEDEKKSAQDQLDALTDIEAKGAKGAELKKKIAEYQTHIDAFSSPKSSGSGGGSTDKADDKLQTEADKRTSQMAEYSASLSQSAKKAENDITQAKIDAMSDGLDKQMAQNKLNYARMLDENEQREAEMVRQYRDYLQTQWEQANPTASEADKSANKTSLAATVGAEQLPAAQKAQITEYADIAAQAFDDANRRSLESALGDVMDYTQKRAKIEKDAQAQIDQMYEKDANGNRTDTFRSGFGQGNVSEVERSRDKALEAVDEEFASRSDQYNEWCDQIASYSLDQLAAVLTQAKAELDALTASGTADSNKLATARAKVAKAESALGKAKAADAAAPNKRVIKDWEDLYKVLNECNAAFEDIGESVGGTAGDVIAAAGKIGTSTVTVVNGIIQLTKGSTTTIEGLSKTAAAAVSAVEKSSVILTIIAAAIQIAMQVVELFNTDDKRQEEIDALQSRIDQLQWELDNADVVRLQESTGTALARVRDTYREISDAVQLTRSNTGGLVKEYGGMAQVVILDNKGIAATAQQIADAYSKMSYTADKALGAAKYDTAKEQLQNIAKQQAYIYEQMLLEQDKKKSDDETLAGYEQKLEELGEDAVSVMNDMVEKIVGDTSDNIAAELGDAFFDAFADGEDAAAAWGDKVNEIVADVVKRMLISQFLEEPLGDIFDKYKAKWYKEGKFQGVDAVVESMSGFAADLGAVGKDFAAIWESLPDTVKNMFTSTASAREASQEGIATASQESVDENNGRLTAIQGHTFSISENTKLLVSNSSAILVSVLHIEDYAEALNNRVAGMETNLKAVKDVVSNIADRGVKIK